MNLRVRLSLGFLITLGAVLLFRALIGSHQLQLLAPRGLIASHQRDVIVTSVLIMFSLAIPMLVIFFGVAWYYREGNKKAIHAPKTVASTRGEVMMWLIPFTLIVTLWGVTWKSAHGLDPYTPIVSDKPPITVQVIALPWKWLFIYPGQRIAMVNRLVIPEKTPIHFQLTADGPVSSFWIPQLGSQIYAMGSMQTQLYLMADETGEFTGKNTEINGDGYSGMTFAVKSVTDAEFSAWVDEVSGAADELTASTYAALARPSSYDKPKAFASVEPGLFDTIMMKDMMPPGETDHSMHMMHGM